MLAIIGTAQGAPLAPGLPLPSQKLEGLLQSFVDSVYLKGFRTLGDERDFDHGHFLFDSSDPSAAPVAILYHTQELAYYQQPGSHFGYIDPDARNWVQWIKDGRVDNARSYERQTYPASASWDWFRANELPALRRHRTILADMLEPGRFGAQALRSSQWVFTRSSCGRADARDRSLISVVLPAAGRVCLSLSRY